MKTRSILLATVFGTAATMAFADAHTAKEITVMSWGGAYSKSQLEAYEKPFAEKTGIKVNSVVADNPATPIKAQVEAGNVTIDVVDVEYADALRLCDDGLLEILDPAILADGADGTAAMDDFLPGAVTDCFVATIVFSTMYAFDETKFPENPPSKIEDFFDVAGFPGKRGMRKTAKVNLEMALMADGVAPGEVYDILETDEGVDRAFAKLETIKNDVVWWEAGAQPPQLLADGEVAMTTAYNGRIFGATVSEGKPFKSIFDGQVYEYDGYAIPKGAPNLEAALEFVTFSTQTQQLADQAKYISYGPARKSSGPLVGLFEDGKTEMGPFMPTAEANLVKALPSNTEFWADRNTDLNERFNAWLAQ